MIGNTGQKKLMSLRLGLFYPNAQTVHTMSREVADANPDVRLFATHKGVAQTAEQIGMDYLFVADTWGAYGPILNSKGVQDPMMHAPILTTALAAVTENLHLISTIHTAIYHPIHIVRMGATIDQLSGGRWGMNLVSGPGLAKMKGMPNETLSHDARYEIAAEFVEIITQAWSTKHIDFHGKHFNLEGMITGPLTIQQPRPLIVSAGASPAGRRFAGRYADYIFMPGRVERDSLNAQMDEMRDIAVASGRKRGDLKAQLHAHVLVRETEAEAREVSDWILSTIDINGVAEYMQGARGMSTVLDVMYGPNAIPADELRRIGVTAGSRLVHAGADQVAETLAKMHTQNGAEGIALSFPFWSPDELNNFARLVLPRLEQMGIWIHPSKRGWTL